jgi:hypothetical protein
MDPVLNAFDGLYRMDTRHGARVFSSGYRWGFDEVDLNESAKPLFRHLDRLFEILRVPSLFLSIIELDAEAGRVKRGIRADQKAKRVNTLRSNGLGLLLASRSPEKVLR